MAFGVGIDIGTRTSRVARIRRTGKSVSWAGSAAASRQPDTFADSLSSAGLRVRRAVAGLSGSSTLIRYTRVPLVPAWKLRMLVQYEATQGGELDASFDYRLLRLPVKAGSTDLTVLTAVAKNDLLTERLGYLAERGVRGVDFVPDALALYEVFARCPEASESLDQYCLVLDIGASKTEMVIVYNGELVFARSISFGGADFTKAVATALKVDEDRAERVKVKSGELLSEQDIAARPAAERPMLAAIAAAAEEFFGTLRASVLFARAQTKLVNLDIGRVYLSGAGARLRGLDAFLARKLGVRSSFLRPPEDWNVPGDPNAPNEWLIALGLALLSLEPHEDRLSILPPAARRRRRFWRADLFAWAACLLFLAAAATDVAFRVRNWAAARTILDTRAEFLKQAKDNDRELADLLDATEFRRGHLQLLASAAGSAPTLVQFLDDLKRALPLPVTLSHVRLLPGDLNQVGAPATVTLNGSVGPSMKKDRDVLDAFRDQVSRSPLYDPSEKPLPFIERADKPSDTDPLQFQIRVPLRAAPPRPKDPPK